MMWHGVISRAGRGVSSLPLRSYGVMFCRCNNFFNLFLVVSCYHKVPLREVSLSQRTTLLSFTRTTLNLILIASLYLQKYCSMTRMWMIECHSLRESLIQRQPFPEFFPIALDMLITEHSKDVTKQLVKLQSEMSTRFAFAYMTYSSSSVIPDELAALPINIFKLPKQNSASIFAPQNVPFQMNRSMLAPEEQVHIAKTLNLEPPDSHASMEEIISREDAVFALIGSPDDSSFDTDDSIPNKIHMQQFLIREQN
ncbi:hypothetical protein DINM_005293 [Dirofilaria immitis]|nr:hypothetical protein [Dirofilaria immitis]